MRLLLIGPYRPLARALLRGLQEEGFSVEVVHDRQEGGSRARAAPYDAILLDLHPPGEQGLEFLREWRRGGLTTPVLLLASSGQDAPRPDQTDLGPCDAVPKPFPMEELLARLRALLGAAHRNGVEE